MKAFVAVLSLAAAALAAPEADPQVFLNQGVYGSHLVKPLTYAVPQVQYVQPQQVQYVQPQQVKYVKPVEYKVVKDEQKTYKPIETVKVEAYSQGEKKFEVPAVSYKQPIAYTAGYPFAPVAYTATQEHIVPAKYHSESAGQVEHTVFKREADPALVYAAGYQGAFPVPYPRPQYPVVSSYAAYNPVAYTHPMYYNAAQLKTYANDAIKPENYASKGQYVAQSAGAIHIAKRDAESQYVFPSVYNTAAVVPTTYNGLYNNFAYTNAGVYNNAYNGVYNYNTLGYRYL